MRILFAWTTLAALYPPRKHPCTRVEIVAKDLGTMSKNNLSRYGSYEGLPLSPLFTPNCR